MPTLMTLWSLFLTSIFLKVICQENQFYQGSLEFSLVEELVLFITLIGKTAMDAERASFEKPIVIMYLWTVYWALANIKS